MLALGIVLLVLLLIFLLLLLAPFELRLDTISGDCCLRWRGIASVRLSGEVRDPVVRLWLLGWRKKYHLLELGGGKEEEEGEAKQRERRPKKGGRPRWLTFRLIRRLLRTFRVHRLRLLLDTDDYVLNAYLFPIFQGFSKGNRQLTINFSGRNELALTVTNRIGKVGWVFLSEIIKPKKRLL